MAELIDKNEAKKMVSYGTYREDYVKVSDLDRLPTTTEAEIRNKAISEFAEKLKGAFSEKSSNVNVRGFEINVLPLDRAIEILWYLKQQLKGE